MILENKIKKRTVRPDGANRSNLPLEKAKPPKNVLGRYPFLKNTFISENRPEKAVETGIKELGWQYEKRSRQAGICKMKKIPSPVDSV